MTVMLLKRDKENYTMAESKKKFGVMLLLNIRIFKIIFLDRVKTSW